MQTNKYQEQRQRILKVLYRALEANPDKGWVYLDDLHKAAGEAEFSLKYLVMRGCIERQGFQYRILADGIDRVEAEQG